jgi:hypothetical protein
MTGTGPHLTRRAVVLAFAAAAVTPFGLSRAFAASSGIHVYRLDPVHRPGPGRSTSNCTGCTACRRHARNKLFANAKAAEVARAHKGCRCTVVRAGTIPAATYAALFGEPGNLERLSVDRRDAKVRAILRSRKKPTATPGTRRKIA